MNSTNKVLSIEKVDNTYRVFDIEINTLNYLENNLKGLDAVILKFSAIIYEKYTLDITKTTTIPSLSLKISLTNSYKSKENVKVITGLVDINIRWSNSNQ